MDFDKLKQMAYDAKCRTDCWREQARGDFALYDGCHWTDEECQYMRDHGIEPLTFNRIPLLVDGITGLEVNNRKEISYEAMRPSMEAKGLNDLLNAASQQFRTEADSEDVESQAFRQMIICGIGATETYIDYDENPDGEMRDVLVDFEELIFDPDARQRNMSDAAVVGRVREMPVDEARAMFGVDDEQEIDACWIEGRDPDTRDENEVIRRVQVVHLQWRAYETVYRSAVNGAELSKDERADIEDAGFGHLIETDGKRRVWKQAFLGASDILGKVEYCPSQDRPSICIMAYEREKGEDALWYGMLRRIRGPQFAANKFLTKMVAAVDYSATGGIIAEEDAFVDPSQAEKAWTDPYSIIWAEKGAIGQKKIQPKPVAQMPLAVGELLEYSVSSIRDVTGLNLEMFGLADRDQAGVVENSRKQSAYTTLAPLFDRLKSYRVDKGRLQLDYIREYLSDERLIRIAGDGGAQYVPMVRLPDEIRFNVQVDEQSTSPDNKARTMMMLPMLQQAVGGPLPPAILAKFLPYSDLPALLINELLEEIAKPNPQAQEQAQLAQIMAQLEMKKAQSEVAENMAQAAHNEAQTVSELAQAAKWQQEAQLTTAKTHNEMLAPQFEAMKQVREVYRDGQRHAA